MVADLGEVGGVGVENEGRHRGEREGRGGVEVAERRQGRKGQRARDEESRGGGRNGLGGRGGRRQGKRGQNVVECSHMRVWDGEEASDPQGEGSDRG